MSNIKYKNKQTMNIIKKKILLLILFVFTNGCSTAITVVDTTATVAVKTATVTVKGVTHIVTCPFTEKDCF